jgi:predicted cupin superfamily sugar epimerase
LLTKSPYAQAHYQRKIASMPTAKELIKQLDLARHPEGGWYRETYRSIENVPAQALPERFGGSRSLSTAIYFLLEEGDISALHRIKSDEIWHFYAGSPLLIHSIVPDGRHLAQRLGPNCAADELYQLVVPAGCWFGAELAGNGFALVACTVAPGFDFADFEMADRQQLCASYPKHAELIGRLAAPAPHQQPSHPRLPQMGQA